MNADDYSLSSAYVQVGNGPMGQIDNFARTYIAGHYMFAFALIIALVLLIVVYWFFLKKENFMPGSTMRMQQFDDRERLDPGAPSTSLPQFYNQNMVSNGISIPTFNPDPNAAPGAPGSLNYLVLNSPDLACATKTGVDTDAWSWMTTNIGNPSASAASGENFTANDSALTKKLAGL